jgi:hypothetical protein
MDWSFWLEGRARACEQDIVLTEISTGSGARCRSIEFGSRKYMLLWDLTQYLNRDHPDSRTPPAFITDRTGRG